VLDGRLSAIEIVSFDEMVDQSAFDVFPAPEEFDAPEVHKGTQRPPGLGRRLPRFLRRVEPPRADDESASSASRTLRETLLIDEARQPRLAASVAGLLWVPTGSTGVGAGAAAAPR
jgi:hypothetical protein